LRGPKALGHSEGSLLSERIFAWLPQDFKKFLLIQFVENPPVGTARTPKTACGQPFPRRLLSNRARSLSIHVL